MKYNIIGDIHGRTSWKKLVADEYINVFVGDYFSPYHSSITFDIQKQNFLDIIQYKKEHPETILLIGNHDEDHWHIHERYSRFDAVHYNEICNLFEEHKDLFQIAYSIENQVLVTHAGASIIWLERQRKGTSIQYNIIDCMYDDNYEFVIKCNRCQSPEEALSLYYNTYHPNYIDINKKPKLGDIVIWKNNVYTYSKEQGELIKFTATPDNVANFINKLWLSGKYSAFNFRNNCNYGDNYGDSDKQSPIWIRPDALLCNNVFITTDYAQVVGHSMFDSPATIINNAIRYFTSINIKEPMDKIFFVDCLEYSETSLIYDSTSKNFTINKKN